jgi:hypothetical protein
LKDIIPRFEDLTNIPSIFGAIDKTHILLKNLPNKKIIFTIGDFFNRKKFFSIVLQVVCDANKIFWNFCVADLKGFTMVDISKSVAYMRSHEVFQELVIIIPNMKCTPFLIDDVVYPICTYLQKN